MANTLKIKRGAAATIPQGQLAEPLFTTDTYDLYIGKGSGGNQRIQNYIASGTSSQFLKGDGSLDSTTYQATSEKGQNNGYASLDAGGKIPVSQLPSSVIEYKGTWNASTNTPTLADGTGDAGDVYIVSVGGTQNLGSGSITFDAGDWVMYNGAIWQKSTGSNAVASVNGQTGIVSIGVNDLDDATITSPSNGQLLQYSTGTNKWVNWTPTYISAAITSLNGLTAASQTFAVGTSGTDFAISSSTSTHTFNLPDASASARGVVTTATQTFAGNKTFSDLLYGNQHIYFGMSTGADYYVRTPNVSTSRRGLILSNGVNTDLKVYAGGTQTLGAWTESDTTLVIGTGYQGGGGSNETILFHSTGIGNLMALTASSGGAIYAYRNIILPANNTVGGTNYCIEQQTASNDGWRLYGNTVANDQAEMVFELYDNAQSWGSNGQRYRFYFNPQSGGIAKNVLIMDYDTAVFTTSVTATSIIRSGGTSSQFLKADGSVDSNTYLTTSSAASTYVPYTGATTNVNIGTNSMTAFNFYASSTYYIDSYNYFMKSILELRDNATSTKRLYITADTSESLISTVNTVPLKLRATSGVTEQVVLNTNGTINFTGAATFSSSVGIGASPSAWGNSYTGLQVNTGMSLFGYGGVNGELGNNFYFDGTNYKRTSAGQASQIVFGGDMYFRYAANSTAGSNISWNNAMFITGSNGNVGIGTTSPGNKLEVVGDIYAQGGSVILEGRLTGGGGILSKMDIYSSSNASGTEPIRFLTANAERMRITSGGRVGINNSNPGDQFVVNGAANVWSTRLNGSSTSGQSYGMYIAAGTTTGDTAILIRNQAETQDYLNIRGGDGFTRMYGVYNNTSANAANVVTTSDNGVQRSTASSLRYKQNIQDWSGNGLETILALKPKTFTYKPEHYKNPDLVMLGLIAEEVAEVSPYLAEYENEDRTGLVENVRYANIVVPLIKAIQEQQQMIEELKSKLN